MKKPSEEEVRRKVDQEPDYVAGGHHGHSLRALRDRYPDGAPGHVVARALARTERQARALYAVTMRQIRRWLGVKLERKVRSRRDA